MIEKEEEVAKNEGEETKVYYKIIGGGIEVYTLLFFIQPHIRFRGFFYPSSGS